MRPPQCGTNGLLSRYPGFDFRRDIQHGTRPVDVVSDLGSPEKADADVRTLADMQMTSATEVPAIPDAGQLLATLPPHQWALVTSGRRGMVLRRLISARLPHPPVLISAEDVSRGKPAPDPYLAGAAQF